MPMEAQEADLILRLCDRFHCLPSQVLDEPADLLRLLAIADMAGFNEEEDYDLMEGDDY